MIFCSMTNRNVDKFKLRELKISTQQSLMSLAYVFSIVMVYTDVFLTCGM